MEFVCGLILIRRQKDPAGERAFDQFDTHFF